jgi:hypothetical protein
MVAVTQSQLDRRAEVRREIDHWERVIGLWQKNHDNPNIKYPPQDYIDGFKERVNNLKAEESRLLALEKAQEATPDGPTDITQYLFSKEDKEKIAGLQAKYNELSKVGPDGQTVGTPEELQELQDEIDEAKEDAMDNYRNRS